MKYCFRISDYEHSGDLAWAKQHLLEYYPNAKNIKTWEERDYEAEEDEEDYDEPVYQGYIEFEAPEGVDIRF